MADLLRVLDYNDGNTHYAFRCPGCDELHQFVVGDSPNLWGFDGNMDAPTVTGSVKVTYNGADADQPREGRHRIAWSICHLFIENGQIRYLTDSTHPLAGQTVPMIPALEGA